MKLLKELESPTTSKNNTHKYGIFECPKCLQPYETQIGNVKNGRSTQCRSCQVTAKNLIHDMSKDINASRYYKMMRRCYDKSSDNYKNYGARGIKVEPFLQDIENYCKYVSSLPNSLTPRYTVDRVDNNLGYTRGNLKWSTSTEQNTNQRKKCTSRFDYIGVYQLDKTDLFGYRIRVEGKRIYKGGFKTQEEAAIARDTFIINNSLPHILTGVLPCMD